MWVSRTQPTSANPPCPLLHVSLLHPFHWCLQISLCVHRKSGYAANLKNQGFRGKEPHACPHPLTPRFPLAICKSYSQEEEKERSCVITCSPHSGVNQGSLCSFLHHLFTLPSLGDLAGKHSLFFILTQRQWDSSYLHRNHASCDWKEHHGMQTERKAVKAPSCGF